MKREILVRLDITGATDAHCSNCELGSALDDCPWQFIPEGSENELADALRLPECIAAEKEAKATEDDKREE